ncbi:MAG: hypothetical protein WD228_01835 [Mycobacterium sp.]
MPAAIRSMFTASVALASAGVIAASPLAPTPELPMPTVHIPSINLVNGSSVPALGAIPYQILVNLLGNALAAAPILLGGIEQCTVCVGPVSPPSPAASPFTGWGTLGVGVGLLTSPFAIIGAVQARQSILQALGVGLLAIQTPIINTATLIQAPRQPFGGYEFEATRARAAQAVVDAVVGAFGVTREVLTGVRTIIAGSLAGVTAFAQTLATTGDVVAAFNAGLAPFTAGIQTAVADTVGAIQSLRAAVYADLTSGPGPATSPIPTVAAPPTATPAAATVAAATVAATARDAASVPTPVITEAATAAVAATVAAGTGRAARRAGAALSPREDADTTPAEAAESDGRARADGAAAESAGEDAGASAARPNRTRSAAARGGG